MRPSISSWNPLESLALASGLVPTPLMLIFWGQGLSRAATAAVRLGIFEKLADGPSTAEALAQKTGCDATALGPLLNALNGFGFLRRHNGRYALTPSTRRWLLSTSKGSVRDVVEFVGDLYQSVEPVEQAIRTGKVVNFHHRPNDSALWRNYVRGLGTFGKWMGGELVKKIPVDRPPKRLLDVGGGHGMYSAAMCRRFPGLAAEVLDLPQVVEHGREMVQEEGLSERIAFRAGDLRTSEWGKDFDLVFLFNILHNLTERECIDALVKARKALRVGGTVVVVDSEHDGGEGDVSATAGNNELFFFLVSGSQAWPEPKVRIWIETAGFGGLKRRSSRLLPNLMVLSAVAR
jgi:hypothetical protein